MGLRSSGPFGLGTSAQASFSNAVPDRGATGVRERGGGRAASALLPSEPPQQNLELSALGFAPQRLTFWELGL